MPKIWIVGVGRENSNSYEDIVCGFLKSVEEQTQKTFHTLLK